MKLPEYYQRNPQRIPAYYRNNWDRLPEYIQKFWHLRARNAQEREDAVVKAKERKEQEYQRQRKLRRPPAKVWRVGGVIFWDPPETIKELRIEGYWVSEKRNGVWTSHGDIVRPDTRHAQLFDATNDARVETKYHQQALGEVYYSPIVKRPGEDPYLVGKVEYYVTEKMFRSPEGAKRWRRVLAGFGVTKAKWVRGRRVSPLEPAMTAAEAQKYADKGWLRWVPVAKALKRIEEIRNA